jgi:dTDP-4-amino-4,6-dideoxygalactose transaminase
MIKAKLKDLAIFGGKPAFGESLHVGRPNVGDRARFKQRVDDIFDTRWLTNSGPCVQEFERKVAELLRVKHCVAVCNGTMGLEIAIRALALTGEVVVPAFTFVATAHALQWQEITPVFCDIDPITHNIDPSKVERMITPRTSGIIGVHLWGRACDVEALEALAKRRNLRLLFDAAHAFGCSYRGHKIGRFGDAEVFSFHATKFFNTFEGGAVATNNDELANKIRLMRDFGFHGYDNVIYIGTNGKMSEISAAMGLTGLESLEAFTSANYRNYKQYQLGLKGIPAVQLIPYDETELNNYQYIVLEIDDTAARVTRDQLVRILHAENVLARRYYYPGCHRMEPYRSYYPNAGLLLPETERLVERVICLPTGTAVGSDEIGEICQIIRFVMEHGGEIGLRLSALKKRFASG